MRSDIDMLLKVARSPCMSSVVSRIDRTMSWIASVEELLREQVSLRISKI
jgi:hypothetical protein